MKAKQDILKIVKEDALRIIGEKKARKVSLIIYGFLFAGLAWRIISI